jgi:hypothetical protein
MDMLINSILTNKQNRFSKRFGEDMVDFFGESFVLPENFSYRLIEVSPEHVARPDLVSKSLYGTTMYGDIICRLNGVQNPFELNEGDVLYVPELQDIDKFLTPANKEDNIEDTDEDIRNDKPSYKKPKEKRAPNEAIIGDTRFKIDKTNQLKF